MLLLLHCQDGQVTREDVGALWRLADADGWGPKVGQAMTSQDTRMFG